ncbi:MAG: hypothetical protein L6Q98_21525 [Anaerolineae bacterium]|nr:hypothetical protein [Anaerolineae bacterium]NUQ05517.1 hypothetical protein [Anaerolineae bacterium]
MGANDFDDLVRGIQSKSEKYKSTDSDFEETVNKLNPTLETSRGKGNRSNKPQVTAKWLLGRFVVGAVVCVVLCLFGCNWVLLRLSVDYPDYLAFLGVVCGGIIGGFLNIAAALITIGAKELG